MKTKHNLLILFFCILPFTVSAQQGINYKAIINDAEGNVLANKAITIQFTILENGTTSVYIETHSPTTDANGILIINIGEGFVQQGDFNFIDWGSAPHYLKTEIDKGEGFVDMGTTEFKTVPYALYARTAGSIESSAIGQYYYADKDGDNYGDPFSAVFVPSGMTQPGGYILENTDCDDSNISTNPGVLEIMGDGIDNNCDGEIDEYPHPELNYSGYWQLSVPVNLDNCNQDDISSFEIMQTEENITIKVPLSGDAYLSGTTDGLNLTANTSIVHLQCINGLNITGSFEDINTFRGILYVYADSYCYDCGGGFSIVATKVSSDFDNDGYTTEDGDCDDFDASINPGATETCGDKIDQDCDGVIDGGCDYDQDGIPDIEDNCPTVSNPTQSDWNNDGIGDACEHPESVPIASVYEVILNCPDENSTRIEFFHNQSYTNELGRTITEFRWIFESDEISPSTFNDINWNNIPIDSYSPDNMYWRGTNPNATLYHVYKKSGVFMAGLQVLDDNYPPKNEIASIEISVLEHTQCSSEFDIDDDGDGYTENEGDCDDTNLAINPNATEIPDEIDNDCDGFIDNYIDLGGDYGVPIDGFPNWEEQMIMVLTNRARCDPEAALVNCITCADVIAGCYSPAPPLEWDFTLNKLARFHAINLTSSGCGLNHNSPCNLIATIGTDFPDTRDGSVSSSCIGGVATCISESNTSTFERFALFNISDSYRAENIVTNGDPKARFNLWLLEESTEPECSFNSQSGHRRNILNPQFNRLGVGASGEFIVQDFWNNGALGAKIPSATHYPKNGGTNTEFRANWYDPTGGAPYEAKINIDGVWFDMNVEFGTGGNATYLFTTNISGISWYYFRFKDSNGSIVTYPGIGAYGIGSVEFWKDSRP